MFYRVYFKIHNVCLPKFIIKMEIIIKDRWGKTDTTEKDSLLIKIVPKTDFLDKEDSFMELLSLMTAQFLLVLYKMEKKQEKVHSKNMMELVTKVIFLTISFKGSDN